MSRDREAAYVRALRAAELDLALSGLATLGVSGQPAQRQAAVLEIGAADGHVASLLADRFGSVAAVDVAVPADAVFPVQAYDGHRLPFRAGQFDLVYSSHVMEHVAHFPAFQLELARVLRPGGLALHIVPTAVWRFWTLLTHYPALPKLMARLLDGGPPAPLAAGSVRPDRRRGPGLLAMRLLAAAPHGETGSALAELGHFRMASWRERFGSSGWQVLHAAPLGLFYTGYILSGGHLPLPARRGIARLTGSSSGCFILRPGGEGPR